MPKEKCKGIIMQGYAENVWRWRMEFDIIASLKLIDL